MCSASATIQIGVETEYLEEHSSEQDEQFTFVYTITITNQDDIPLKLLRRHWHITDGNGKTNEVEGEGVVGKQPTLKPKKPFTYTSSVVIQTPVGVMEGNYTLQTEKGELLSAPIPAFRLAKPNSLH
ncbi:Co2+/Mg2+ efflux protein ApaG [Celerinatantimonas diazotrophica]|uniref:Protein ApaG n=1 Tax=Celerinatantimonas diazotrophica TaxID=412034 RepID=A0A4R1KIL8_9GAMM|nr:Co2+/Mg2+ efflux protein ApaG [Celerinatantimonas diazotrophica]TCK63259.1 ApaG protein [Celerinatantimonas diazotrophica]CAG9295628.1 Protein ApaG [Celerinatantimonas diazotrophica]